MRKRERAALDDAYLPLKELATYAGLSERTLRDYLHHPLTPMPHYMVGRKVVVRRSEYDVWIEQFRRASTTTDNPISRHVNVMIYCDRNELKEYKQAKRTGNSSRLQELEDIAAVRAARAWVERP